MKPETLTAAQAAVTKRDDTASSAHLIELRDALDLRGAQSEIDALTDRRYRCLLTASDAEIESIDNEMRAAHRDQDRRRAAAEALAPLIDAAKEREAQEAIKRLGVEASAAHEQLLREYVALDAAAAKLADCLDAIGGGEAFVKDANARLRAAGRQDLTVPLPLDQLMRLAECEFDRLPRLGDFLLPGYMDTLAALQGDPNAIRKVPPARRFGRLADLLPEGGRNGRY
jgi:hypothetical protein